MRAKMMGTLGVEYLDRPHPTSGYRNTLVGGYEEPDGFATLNRVQTHLNSMRSGKLKTALRVLGAAARVSFQIQSPC